MTNWNGFTDEELKKLKSESENNGNTKLSKIGQVPRSKKAREKKITANERVLRQEEQKSFKDVKDSSSVNKDNHNVPIETPIKNEPISDQKNEVNVCKEEEKVGVLSDEKVAELEISNLEKLQFQQKHIEEQNKKKQMMIKETLQKKFKETQSEATKLKEIQKQLNKLDESLQVDVEILRNKIDESCVLYSHAQKRFERAEAEYVEAKLDFFQKKEQKQQMTEHLYSIIQENEIRKAKKLEELMLKLGDSSPKSASVSSNPEETTSGASINNNKLIE